MASLAVVHEFGATWWLQVGAALVAAAPLIWIVIRLGVSEFLLEKALDKDVKPPNPERLPPLFALAVYAAVCVVFFLSLVKTTNEGASDDRARLSAAEATIQSLVTDQKSARRDLDSVVGPLGTVEADVSKLQGESSERTSAVLPSVQKPPEFRIIDAACGPAAPARVDVYLHRSLRAGFYYWALRSDRENPGRYPVGPPKQREQDPVLTFALPMPICGRQYTTTAIECDEAGDSAIRDVVNAGPEAVVQAFPSGCVELGTAELTAGQK